MTAPETVAAIQVRMGSTRLPGKAMLPLSGEHVLEHVVHRLDTATAIDDIIVATTETTADDIVARYADRAGATVFRGSETDVLGRMVGAIDGIDADVVVRITGDCPLVAPAVVDAVVDRLRDTAVDYCSNTLERTFPRGLDVEAATVESLRAVESVTTEPHHREHVTQYYHGQQDTFEVANVESTAVFEAPWLHDRTDLRLTLDEADDYELLREIYERVPFEGVLPVRDAIRCVDENGLDKLNGHVEQKET